MEPNDVLACERTERFHTADGQVPVGMRGIQQPEERAFRHRRRKIGELTEPIEPELANTLEVGILHRRRDEHPGQQRCATFGKPP